MGLRLMENARSLRRGFCRVNRRQGAGGGIEKFFSEGSGRASCEGWMREFSGKSSGSEWGRLRRPSRASRIAARSLLQTARFCRSEACPR
ncbi:hypothetical protein C6Q18_20205 [Pseudomonas chlororaphis subsp. piscium]|nr:hypothetical protein C6Q18_20205 [Pseudomonas chlororaphis subsp. piscium]